MDVQQTTVKTDMQSDENSGEDGEARANLGGEQKVIGFLTEWVSAYHFIKGMVLISFRKSIQKLMHGGVPHSLYPPLSVSVACYWTIFTQMFLLSEWHDFNGLIVIILF